MSDSVFVMSIGVVVVSVDIVKSTVVGGVSVDIVKSTVVGDVSEDIVMSTVVEIDSSNERDGINIRDSSAALSDLTFVSRIDRGGIFEDVA